MKPARRDLSLLLPALLLPQADAQSQNRHLPSKVYRFEDLKASRNAAGRVTRPVLNGATHTGFQVEIHHTELPPGEAPHAPHRHIHEEMIVIRQGTMEVTISGQSQQLGPGSIAYVASNEEHGWRNVGDTQAHYVVIALGS